ncbi:unnamed protein product, partial [Iphiclides podalirius]
MAWPPCSQEESVVYGQFKVAFSATPMWQKCVNNTDNSSSNVSNNGCVQWVYENPNSLVAEFQLAGQEWKRTLIGTMHNIGYMVGLIIVGSFSDRFGRKNAVAITATLGGFLGLAKSFSPSYWLYIALEFAEATFGDCYSPAYILTTEIVSLKDRLKFISICKVGCSLSGIALSVAAWQVPYWRTLLRVLYTPALLFFTYKIFLYESPRWLLIKGDRKKAADILIAAAKKNKIELSSKILEGLTVDEAKPINFLDVVKSTFRSNKLRGRVAMCLVWWITSAFVSHGMSINSVFLSGSKFINFGLLSVLRLPGLFIIMYILTYGKRKFPLMCCFFAGAILCVSQPFIPPNLSWLSVMIYVIGDLMSSFFFYITYLYTSELFPTYTRNTMHALCSSVGRIGSILAPQTPLLISYWSGLPSMVFGLASLLAGLITLLAPDVSNEALPDTVEQAEALGRKKLQTKNLSSEISRI